MLHEEKPHNFTADMKVSEGILEFEWKILVVQRANHCSSPGTWSGPGGKLEKWENHDEALIRELQEEIWVEISEYPQEVIFKKYFYFLWKNIEIKFYRISCDSKPKIILNNEHQAYKWIYPHEALNINLTEDFDTILKEIYWLWL